MLRNPTDPQPSLAAGDYKPSPNIAAPIVNSVDTVSTPKAMTAIPHGVDWLTMSRVAYESSESWLQINQRAVWARNFAHYRSEHAPDSPILSESNKHRAKHFFPKTRVLVRQIQAAGAAAYFASSDVVVIEAQDQDSPQQVEAANLMKELTNYHLNQTIPWYLLNLGGLAEVSVTGSVASHQSWEFEEKEIIVGHEYDTNAQQIFEVYGTKTVIDRPKIRLVPIENLRMSPGLDWLDPANSTPYLIELTPMYVGDILTKIAEGKDPKNGEPAWNNVGESNLIASGNRDNMDAARRARAGSGKQDPKSNMTESQNEFRVVWIHRNIIRHNGIDWLYYTVGTNIMLSEPVPLATVIPWANGKRDYVIGKIEVETDRPYPSGPVELSSGMQKALNELKNQRYDNVRQVLNRRYLYRAGNQVDVRALTRNVPGGLIGVSAPGPLNNHVEPLPVQDVTASSFQEEDRLSLSMDDLTGSTNGSTVNSNRRLHETATGMNLMMETGSQIREMELRTFTETWVEPVLRQIVQLIAAYETDRDILTVAAKKLGIKRILPEYFNQKFVVSVNVGMGATSPTQRMQRVQSAVATVVGLVPDAAMAVNGQEIAKEVFGAAGYDNGSRFFDFSKVEQQKSDPQLELQAQAMQMKQQIDQGKLELAQAKLQLDGEKMGLEQAKVQGYLKELDAKINLLIAQKAGQNVTTVYEATQAAGVVAQNPGIAPVTDEILNSVGFVDQNAAPVIEEVPQQRIVEPEKQNTHPAFPPTGTAGIMKGLNTSKLET